MKYERLTDEQKAITSCDNCTWDSPKLKVKIKPMPFLTIDGNVYSPQEQASIRLKYLEDLIEQGKLIELPCKVGDTVYGVTIFGHIISATVKRILFYDDKIWVETNISNFGFETKEVNKGTVFTDKSEAEAKLKELQNESI